MLADALQAQGPSELKRALATYGEAMHDAEARKHALLGFALALPFKLPLLNGERNALVRLSKERS